MLEVDRFHKRGKHITPERSRAFFDEVLIRMWMPFCDSGQFSFRNGASFRNAATDYVHDRSGSPEHDGSAEH